MAVKVMVAPSIAKGDLQKPARSARGPGEAPKPKRRRSSVYDADGNEVFLTLMCLKCHKMRPLAQFGLRRMADGAIRNQPWCRSCRSGTGAEKARPEAVDAVEAAPPADPIQPTPAEAPKRPSASVAAEVAAALAAGLRR